ncbi:MAG TPA: DNA polymerase III subunit alpha [Puia sp.]|nr:DNA polymerase III subunit alpha [Puia sp.]
MYINCKSYFSFHYGTFSTEELVKAGGEAGATALALTNINATCDAWDFLKYCGEQQIKPILGVEIRNGHQLLYILLARNNNGFRWINEFLSEHLMAKKDFPAGAPESAHVFVIYPLGSKEPSTLLVNEYIGIQPTEVNKLLRIPVASYPDKFIVRQPVTFQNKTYYNLHRLLRAVDKNTLLSKLPPEEQAGEQEYFLPQAKILEVFQQFPSLIINTYKLIDACEVTMQFGEDKNKKVFGATREDDRILLEKLAREGFLQRYGASKVAAERMTRELRIIDEMGFNAYFLITLDMIRYARSRGFYHVGRGSGANSLVAYCLQITDVDPIELDLYFERFLNPQRTSPPDFDIDFSYRDRDEVIDYMFSRYGRQHVVLLGMYTTFQYNAIIRELGKVFGLPKSEIDQLAEKGYYHGGGPRSENFMKKPGEGKIQRMILQYGKLLLNFPNHLSIHPGGILISEEPMTNWCALHRPPKGFPTAQMDMFVAENIGLYKLDVLSQRGLGHIKESLELIKKNRHIDVDIHQVQQFKKDEKVRAQIRSADTIGCFYIESPAMRNLLKKLRCDDYLSLVAASSIIRPGVGSSGMMQQYIYRFHNPDKFEYLHPRLEELLKETYGVMVYQEDVLKVAHYWAGLDMADADLLRRATSSKYRGKKGLMELKERFFSNCAGFGYPLATTEEVWRQIESFAEYSFCKAHSASYAVESYQSLFLKTHFPMEFAVAVINNFGGFYSRELYFYELMKTGAKVHAPCVNNSDYYTNIEGEEVHVGFVHVRGLEQVLVEKLLYERSRGGPYLNLTDFIERTAVTTEMLETLIRVGALRFTGKNKKELLWEGDFLQKKNRTLAPAHQALFKEAPLQLTLPALPVYDLDDIYDEVELLGFPVRDPFGLVDDDPSRYMPVRELAGHLGKTVTVLGYHITHKPVRTVKGDTMSFGTFLDPNKDWVDTVHFPEIHALYPPQAGFYRITGKVIEEFGVYSIEVRRMEKAGIRGKGDRANGHPEQGL